MAQAVDSPGTTGPQPAPQVTGRTAETGNTGGETASERPKVAAELVRSVPASEITASRPIDPGVGAGEDIVFVLYPRITSETDEKLEYLVEVPKYVRTAMPQAEVYWPQNLGGLVAYLTGFADQGRRIRRLRIIAHSTKGAVLTISEDSERVWVGPKTVQAYARRPEVRELMNRVLTPEAVVEFWGCNLGKFKRSGNAWANLFGRRFVAPRTWFVFYVRRIYVGLRPYRRNERLHEGELVGRLPLHPEGPWVYRQVKKLGDVEAAGPVAVEDFKAELLRIYHEMRAGGLLPDLSGEEGGTLGAMRRLFEKQGDDKSGRLLYIGLERPKEEKRQVPIMPDEPAWKKLWQPFAPAEQAAPSAPAPRPPAPPVTEKPPAPPASEKETALPPTGEKQPAPAEPPARTPPPTPPAIAKETAPAPAPAVVKETPAPVAPEPAPAVPAVRRLPPAGPRAVPAETVWARRHPEGRVTRAGRDEWLLWNFGVGSAAVKPQHAPAFEQIAAEFAAAPGNLQILGLASASGSVTRNVHLSMARAQSVKAMLSVFDIRPALTTVTWSGGRMPRTDPEDAARDRAVLVRIPLRSRRRPLAPVEEAIDRTARPSPPARPPESPPLGFTFKEKLWKFGKEFPLGVDWILVAEAEAGYQIELLPGASANVAAAFDAGKWDGEIKVGVSEGVDVKGTLKDAAISVTFSDVPLKPELKIGLGDLLENAGKLSEKLAKEPLSMLKLASVKFTIPLPKWTEVDLRILAPGLAGVPARVKPTAKISVSIAPGPVLLGRLGVTLLSRAGALGGAAAPVVAGIVGGAAWTILALYLINRAHQRGENWAHVVNLRRGYAYRVAAEAADWQAGELRGSGSTRSWDEGRRTIGKALAAGPRSMTETQMESFKTTYAALYDGWESAGRALDQLNVAQYDQLMRRLRQVAGVSYDQLVKLIFPRLGGDVDDETPLSIDWLAAGPPATTR